MILNENVGGQLAVLLPAVVDPGAEVRLGGKGVRLSPPLPPEGEEEDKGGGEEAQEDEKVKRERREVCKKEGGAPIQADPKLQSNDGQQRKFNSEEINTQGRPTVTKYTVHSDMQYKFVKQLPGLELVHNPQVNEATGLAPFLAFKGWEAKLPADKIQNVPHQPMKVTESGTDPGGELEGADSCHQIQDEHSLYWRLDSKERDIKSS
ncbi:MAG: hypothetical protein GY696_25805 [Gammaproteobacteria bacterium]|nr:hypothetical protein [Gammaproteobacteria bacterium]